MKKRWIYQPLPDEEKIATLSAALNIHKSLSSILIQRGITTFDEAKNFFRPVLENLYDPFLMLDMDKAVSRIDQAINQEEKILVYGDYDVDGTTSVALVYSYLKKFYSNCVFYIPDRYSEGYGVSEEGVNWASQNGVTLIIALDLGIKDCAMVSLAKGKGIDFIICDHHLPDVELPDAVAILDPKRLNCCYPFKELSGCGIGFKLVQAFSKKYRDEKEIFDYLDLVAVSIASDIVPIQSENRILAFYGLKKLNQNPLPGIKALVEITGFKSELDISGIVFTLGPRINAAGRVAHAHGAVELLISKNEEEANALAEKVDLKNKLRKEFDINITEEALAMIEADGKNINAKTTVLYKETWHKGVIGIVASRCVEKYYRPTIVLTQSNGKITGSARSVYGFDLYTAIEACSDLLDKFGGHKYAAGLTIDPVNLQAFRQRFEEVVASTITEEMLTPAIHIDSLIDLDQISYKFFNILKQMGPFGPQNAKPVFEARNVFVVNSLTLIKEKHFKFIAGQQGKENVFNAIAFDRPDLYEGVAKGELFNMAFSIEESTFNGLNSLQLRIKDIQFT